jgi:hypothetical protein
MQSKAFLLGLESVGRRRRIRNVRTGLRFSSQVSAEEFRILKIRYWRLFTQIRDSAADERRLSTAGTATGAYFDWQYLEDTIGCVAERCVAISDRQGGKPFVLAGDMNQKAKLVRAMIQALRPNSGLRVLKSKGKTHTSRASGKERTLDFVITNMSKRIKVTAARGALRIITRITGWCGFGRGFTFSQRSPSSSRVVSSSGRASSWGAMTSE